MVLSLYAKNCELCGEKPSKFVCFVCGRYVCEKHYNERLERCLACAETQCDICRTALATSRCIECNRKICHGCAIELDEVRRICYSCFIKYGISVLR